VPYRRGEAGNDVFAASLESEFAHHFIEQFFFCSEDAVGSDPSCQGK
jgi:hypothetical protein